jgi:hypothetical protein
LASRLMHRLEHELDARRVPYAVVGGDLCEHALEHGRWTIVLSAGALEAELVEAVLGGIGRGKAMSFAGRPVERDGSMRPLARAPSLPPKTPVEPLLRDDDTLGSVIDSALSKLSLSTIAAEPRELHITVHVDASATPRVAFLINPTERDVEARLEAAVERATDALDCEPIRGRDGALELVVRRRSVRMLELEPRS